MTVEIDKGNELNGTKKSSKTYCIFIPSLEAGNQLGQGLYLNLVPFGNEL